MMRPTARIKKREEHIEWLRKLFAGTWVEGGPASLEGVAEEE